jgi:hypothetical protein
MQTVTIGFDTAKSVFQVHGVDSGGQVVIRRQLKRHHVLAFFEKLPPCLVGIRSERTLLSSALPRPSGISCLDCTSVSWVWRRQWCEQGRS